MRKIQKKTKKKKNSNFRIFPPKIVWEDSFTWRLKSLQAWNTSSRSASSIAIYPHGKNWELNLTTLIEKINLIGFDGSNCLVGKGFTVKISDVAVYRTLFSRDYYYIDGRGSLPVRWMAPETLLWVSFLSLSLCLSIYREFLYICVTSSCGWMGKSVS